jgi:TIR domain
VRSDHGTNDSDLDLHELRKHAREYVEMEGHTKVVSIRFKEILSLFGEDDAVFLAKTTDSAEPNWWVVGGSTPMNLYAQSKFPSADEAFSFHRGLMLRVLEKQMLLDASHRRGRYDAFISHATEDKDTVVRPLAAALVRLGFQLWFDQTELRVGDGLRKSIDRGLSKSRYGIVVLSKAFFAKNWPRYELDGLTAREVKGRKVILPIWHGVTGREVLKYSAPLADKIALSTGTMTIQQIARTLGRELISRPKP